MFKYLNDVPPSDYWFPYEYMYAEVKEKVNETKGQLAGNEMEKEYTGYHRHMITVVAFFYSNTLKIMLVDYVVTEMGCFGDY